MATPTPPRETLFAQIPSPAHLSAAPSAGANQTHQLSPTFFLQRAAQIEPDAEAIYHTTANGKTLRRTYREFADRARGLAYYLQARNLKRIGILMPNTPGFLEAIFGIAAAGAVNVAVNYRLKAGDISYIFTFSKVDAILVDAEFEHLLEEFSRHNQHVPIIIDTDTDSSTGELSGPFDHAILEGLKYDLSHGSYGWENLWSERIPDENDMIAVPFTSGTTAKPKGVIYTHRGCYIAALGNVIENGLNTHKGRCGQLWVLPMFHAMGWTLPWAVTAVRGTHFCLRKVDYPLIWKMLKTENITHFSAAPIVNTLLCASPEAERLENPVRVAVAASPPSAHLFKTMTSLNFLPVHVYGMTETYGPVTKSYDVPARELLTPEEKYSHMERQGHGFVTGQPVRVIKPDQPEGTLIDVRRDGKEIGEIVFIGNLCTKGYLYDEEATSKLWAGGVLHTGDLAVWHPDGSVHIVDRAKDVIISGGENISSIALEAMLVQHPDVLEAGVVAVPDSYWGERPKAFITTRDSAFVKSEDLLTWARNKSSISKFMVPREIEIVRELPKTSTGKIKKNVLRRWAEGDKSES